jgi:hypothetical protein
LKVSEAIRKLQHVVDAKELAAIRRAVPAANDCKLDPAAKIGLNGVYFTLGGRPAVVRCTVTDELERLDTTSQASERYRQHYEQLVRLTHTSLEELSARRGELIGLAIEILLGEVQAEAVRARSTQGAQAASVETKR